MNFFSFLMIDTLHFSQCISYNVLLAFAKRVVAVELNKALCIAANENLAVNKIKNVLIIPCDSEVFAKRILKNKSYTREDTGEEYDFKIVLVDPPR